MYNNIMTILLLNSVLIFALFTIAMSNHQIYTKTQLRGFHQKMINEAFEEKIQEIIKDVIRYANNNLTSYTQFICLNHNHYGDYDYTLNKKTDFEIIQKLQDTLIDSNITIIEYSHRMCERNYQEEKINVNARKLIINWD
jgi:hypothetical protein